MEHATDSLQEGEALILTFKDKGVLQEEEQEDVHKERARRTWRCRRSSLTPCPTPRT